MWLSATKSSSAKVSQSPHNLYIKRWKKSKVFLVSWYRCQIFLWKGVNSHSISAYSGRYLNKLLHCKLQSELADPTQFLLIRIGVDFVFHCHNKNKKKNPRLAFTRRNGFTWLKLGGCPVGAWRLSACCWMGVRSVSIGYLELFQRAC